MCVCCVEMHCESVCVQERGGEEEEEREAEKETRAGARACI